jgi:signal peptidase II
MTNLFTRVRLIGIGIALTLFAADQWLKGFVVDTLGLAQVGDHYPLLPFFDLTRTNNYGVSLGMFPATSLEMRWALVAVTALMAMVVFVWMMRERKMWDIAALAMILGGALGNIRDRFLYGYVVDFADFHIGSFRPFMIFNLADAAITIGVVILLARALFMSEKPATEQDKGQSGPNPAETD